MPARPTLTMALLVTLAVCARVGVPGPAPSRAPGGEPSAMTESALAGLVTLGGRRLRALVRTTTDAGGRGTGHLEIPDLGVTADGSARWTRDALELDLRYDGDCPGNVEVRAERTGDGDRVEGTLRAKDCTGEESGTVALDVVPPGGSSGEGVRAR